MPWSLIASLFIPEIINSFKTTTANSSTPVTTSAKPSEAIKALQGLLNRYLRLDPSLQEDGWLGPKTEAAIMQAIKILGF